MDHVKLSGKLLAVHAMFASMDVVITPVEVELLEDVSSIESAVLDVWEVMVVVIFLQLKHHCYDK